MTTESRMTMNTSPREEFLNIRLPDDFCSEYPDSCAFCEIFEPVTNNLVVCSSDKIGIVYLCTSCVKKHGCPCCQTEITEGKLCFYCRKD